MGSLLYLHHPRRPRMARNASWPESRADPIDPEFLGNVADFVAAGKRARRQRVRDSHEKG
jgi:hypothetical protein